MDATDNRDQPDQWEYKTLSWAPPRWGQGRRLMLRDAQGTEYGRWDKIGLYDELLNRLGKEGWELCACSRGYGIFITLKRRIASA